MLKEEKIKSKVAGSAQSDILSIDLCVFSVQKYGMDQTKFSINQAQTNKQGKSEQWC